MILKELNLNNTVKIFGTLVDKKPLENNEKKNIRIYLEKGKLFLVLWVVQEKVLI